MKNQILLDGDVLDITNRLKEVDESYFVVYNHKLKHFEVHSSLQRGSSYCFSVPYEQLDERTILLARKTYITRKDELIRQMDNENLKIQKSLMDLAAQQIKEVIKC